MLLSFDLFKNKVKKYEGYSLPSSGNRFNPPNMPAISHAIDS
jgi:hypothetical protein